jgi:hypothetical protein
MSGMCETAAVPLLNRAYRDDVTGRRAPGATS